MFSIQSIQGTVNRRAGVSLSLEVLAEQEAWAAGQTLPTCAEIQEAINTVLSSPHATPEEWRAVNGIHEVRYAGKTSKTRLGLDRYSATGNCQVTR